MDAATLRSIALRGGGYSTPRLNDSLQAHGAGLCGFLLLGGGGGGGETRTAETAETDKTENNHSPLAAYSCLKSLNLADNGFESLEGMPRLGELKCLFIERNCLSSLRGLSRAAPRLSTLDASGNRLTEVKVEAEAEAEGASSGGLPRSLETLRLSGNDLSGPEALRGLFLSREGEEGEGEGEGQGEGEGEGEAGSGESGGGGGDASPSLLPLLSTLDLSYCSITDAETVLSLLRSLPSLRALYLQGNPFWESLSGGRQGGGGGGRLAVLAACPLCAYLNDAPVFGDERAAADAWRESKGSSLEAARAAREDFLEAAALEAEKTTRLLERPPRFLRLVEEEVGDEEPDRSDSFDDEKRSEEGEEEKKKAEGAEPGGAAVGVVVVEEEA